MSDRKNSARDAFEKIFGKGDPTNPAKAREAEAGEAAPAPPPPEAKGDMSQADFSGYGKKPQNPAAMVKALRKQ